MDWFDQLKDRLFGTGDKPAGQLHRGPLERSEAFLLRHRNWMAREAADLLERYREQLEQEVRHGDSALHLLHTPQASGMQLKLPEGAAPDSLAHLLELFKDRVLAMGYRLQMADQRITTDGTLKERYYLKPTPPAGHGDAPLPQRYGNVLVEAWGSGQQLRHLKVLCTVYSDRLYQEAESTGALWTSLLSTRGLPFS
jgi:hypothetical protein